MEVHNKSGRFENKNGRFCMIKMAQLITNFTDVKVL